MIVTPAFQGPVARPAVRVDDAARLHLLNVQTRIPESNGAQEELESCWLRSKSGIHYANRSTQLAPPVGKHFHPPVSASRLSSAPFFGARELRNLGPKCSRTRGSTEAVHGFGSRRHLTRLFGAMVGGIGRLAGGEWSWIFRAGRNWSLVEAKTPPKERAALRRVKKWWLVSRF